MLRKSQLTFALIPYLLCFCSAEVSRGQDRADVVVETAWERVYSSTGSEGKPGSFLAESAAIDEEGALWIGVSSYVRPNSLASEIWRVDKTGKRTLEIRLHARSTDKLHIESSEILGLDVRDSSRRRLVLSDAGDNLWLIVFDSLGNIWDAKLLSNPEGNKILQAVPSPSENSFILLGNRGGHPFAEQIDESGIQLWSVILGDLTGEFTDVAALDEKTYLFASLYDKPSGGSFVILSLNRSGIKQKMYMSKGIATKFSVAPDKIVVAAGSSLKDSPVIHTLDLGLREIAKTTTKYLTGYANVLRQVGNALILLAENDQSESGIAVLGPQGELKQFIVLRAESIDPISEGIAGPISLCAADEIFIFHIDSISGVRSRLELGISNLRFQSPK